MHAIAAKAVALKEASQPAFTDYSRRVVRNAARLADNLTAAGLRLVSGGTDNHLFLIDVSVRGLTGAKAEGALDAAGITVNKNAIPFDKQPPKTTSGLRLGAPAITTRGMGEPEMDLIAEYVTEVLADPDNGGIIGEVRKKVAKLCDRFPLYGEVGGI
jgi:glycine hydroxymethyltransferase